MGVVIRARGHDRAAYSFVTTSILEKISLSDELGQRHNNLSGSFNHLRHEFLDRAGRSR